jgi:4-hydroxy-2-oxoheptanedioate aldolase
VYKNPFKAKLLAREPVAGCIIQGAIPPLAEIAGLAGFDFLFIDAEHGPLSEKDCEDLVRAAEVRKTVPVIRVPANNPEVILRYMDIGAMGIIIPGVTSKEEAEKAVRAVKYFPRGNRGLSGTRASDYGLGKPLSEYVVEANDETVVLTIIENPEALENLEEIMAVDGLDGVILGTTDFSQALGVPGKGNHEKVVAAYKKFIEKGNKSGQAALGVVVRPGETPKQHFDQGVTILVTTAYGLFAGEAKRYVASVRSI